MQLVTHQWQHQDALFFIYQHCSGRGEKLVGISIGSVPSPLIDNI